MVSQYTRYVARPEYDQAPRLPQRHITVEKREALVPVIEHSELRPGVVRARRVSMRFAAWVQRVPL